MARRIYFDHAATTPLDPRVREALRPYLESEFGNPSSLHTEGRAAREAVEQARSYVGALVGARPEQVVFTSGGTEADNLALASVARGPHETAHVITSAIEHPAVLQTCRALAQHASVDVTQLGVDGDGIVDAEELRAALRPSTRLVSVMGFDGFRARGVLRITLGRFNTTDEVDSFLKTLPRIVSRLRPITTRFARPVGAST